ncbi:MAG: hypothetical protein SEPTF4163_003939, partial [Sporothrix epigloea]
MLPLTPIHPQTTNVRSSFLTELRNANRCREEKERRRKEQNFSIQQQSLSSQKLLLDRHGPPPAIPIINPRQTRPSSSTDTSGIGLAIQPRRSLGVGVSPGVVSPTPSERRGWIASPIPDV